MTLSPGPALHLYDLLELFHGPFFQLPDLSHGFIEAGHLGRQFVLFLGELREQKETHNSVAQSPSQLAMFPACLAHLPYIACTQGPVGAGFHLFCFHLNWLLPTGSTVGAQLLDPEKTRRSQLPQQPLWHSQVCSTTQVSRLQGDGVVALL